MLSEKRGLLQLIVFRLIVVSSLLISAVAIQESTSIFLPLDKFYFVTLAACVLSIIYLLLYYWGKHVTGQAHVQVALDLAIVTALVYISGGIAGPLYFVYVFPILGSSLVLTIRGVYLTASASAIIFGLLVEGLFYRIIPYFQADQNKLMSFGLVLYSLVVAWGLFFAIAFLITTLARNLRTTREQLEWARRELQIKEHQALAGRVSSQIAHEIRNPLAAIAGSVQVLKNELAVSDDQRKLMDIVLRESERISLSIDQFLDLAGPPKIALLPIDLIEILRETVLMLRQSGELNGSVVLEGNYDEAQAPFLGNAHHFKQVFWNLVKNAVQAMPRGGRLRLQVERLKKNAIRLVFADTGVGMTEETKVRIFEPFYSDFEDGRGLGMAVVRSIIDDYQGTISIKSELDHGTEIVIVLPGQAKPWSKALGESQASPARA
jgi:two-component system sensor histidine kinase PilS (NtrC family)